MLYMSELLVIGLINQESGYNRIFHMDHNAAVAETAWNFWREWRQCR